MIEARLWQAKEGPRWLITIGYSDRVTPKLLHQLCAEGRLRWGITKAVVRWMLRDDANHAVFDVDMEEVEHRPEEVLMAIGSSMVRSACRSHLQDHLPLQFFGGQTPVLDEKGRPVPVKDAGENLRRFSPVHPNARKPTEGQAAAQLDELLASLRGAEKH